MTKKELLSKVRNADKVEVYQKDHTYFILAYKNESKGYQSAYKQTATLYFIGLNFDRGFYTDHKFSGKNIKEVKDRAESECKEVKEDGCYLASKIYELRKYTDWKLEQRLNQIRKERGAKNGTSNEG